MILGVSNTTAKLKNLFMEIFLNKTDKVSDISDNSVLNATAFGVAKVSQKCMKELGVSSSKIFPDTASGTDLDVSASLFGVPSRKGMTGSSAYVRVVGDKGTRYVNGSSFFNSTSGVKFVAEETVTIGDSGYAYVKIKSVDVGSVTNVEAFSINTVTPVPVGHISCTNEFNAVGGRDVEDDESFRKRVKDNLNILSKNTCQNITQILINLDPRVMGVFNAGVNELGQTEVLIYTVNGARFTDSELLSLAERATPYMSMNDGSIYRGFNAVTFKNVDYVPVGGDIGVDIRVELSGDIPTKEAINNIYSSLTNRLNFSRFIEEGIISWTELFFSIKNSKGVKFIPDEFFFPKTDITAPTGKLPVIKKIIIRDIDGNIISTVNNFLPIFYQ